MAEPLKNSFGPGVPARIAAMIEAIDPRFPAQAFLADALDGYEALELTPRAGQIADALHRHLPPDYELALAMLMASVGPWNEQAELTGMAPFIYLPHVIFVARYGLDHFEPSMQAQYELTQRFTAEFSIRPFLERYPERTLARLREWALDRSIHVRRLVSEGTRPRLPWAPRLRAFQRDPSPVLELLELLKDDREEYVRRSVANNLNDIGKDHPEVLVATCERWAEDASPERRRLIRHALRSLVKAGHPGALAVLGFASGAVVELRGVSIEPARARIGERVSVGFEVVSRADEMQPVLVDMRVHFVKANGATSPKVFKIGAAELAPGEAASFRKTISLAEMTTRRHYSGMHRIDVLINGEAHPAGAFEVVAAGAQPPTRDASSS